MARTVSGFQRFRPWHRAYPQQVGGAADPISILGAKLAAWYTSDPATLFTTSTGETPVTAASDPVGLRLDKSQGLELGSELVADTTPDFRVLRNGVDPIASYLPGVTLAAGKYYRLDLLISDNVGSAASNFSVSGAGLDNGSLVIAGGFNGRITRYVQSTAGGVVSISPASTTVDFIVRECSIKLLDGAHARNNTPTARPLYQVTPQRIVYDGVDDTLVTTFAATVGADCTVARAIPGTGASITTGVNIGTSFTDSVTAQELVIANAALTAGETAALTAYLNRVAGV